VWQLAQGGTTSLAPEGGIVTLPTEAREEPTAGILSGRRDCRGEPVAADEVIE
jgi:hypothetical protein